VLTTPIDAHLPLVIALVLVCAWVARGTRWCAVVQCAAPMLIAAMMTIADERTRLMAYGVIVAAAFGFAMISVERRRPAGWPGGVPPPDVMLAAVGIVLLRWIPTHYVHVVKELLILAGGVALLFVIDRRRDAAGPAGGTPALLGVLAVAVVTPITPGKMALLPIAVAILAFATRRVPQLAVAAVLILCACFARYSLATVYLAVAIVFVIPLMERVRPLAYSAALVVFALWPWSGIVARALPVVWHYDEVSGDARPIVSGLASSEALPIAVPPHVRHVVLTTSGAQMARLRPGRVVGVIEAGDARGRITKRDIVIGDVADFGFTRREQFFGSRNPLPRFSPGDVRDYGSHAWLWGAGRTAIASNADISTLQVIAAPNLPANAHLQIDSVEFPSR
jgi:hypothetical protein